MKFNKVEAENLKEQPFTGINVAMSVTEAKRTSDGDAKLGFTYVSDFKPGVAKLTMHGYVLVSGEKKELDAIVDAWNKKKPLPKGVSEPLANLITFTSQVNGVLVSKALNMPVPLLPPRIKLSESGAPKKKRK